MADYYTGGSLEEYHPFEIVISYSKDGEIWSNPVEIYQGHNKGSKYSAPYICITESDQIIISFQTDENSVNSGYKGDLYSIMKIIISKPGIPIEKIDKDSFFAVTNNNKDPIGGSSLWNGMMLIGNIIYTCSSNHSILFSELPIYDEPSKYNDMLKKKYQIITGDADFYGDKIITKGINNIIINKEFKFDYSLNIYTNMIPNIMDECGIIFGVEISDKEIISYFFLSINKEGIITLKQIIGNNLKKLYPYIDSIKYNYNKENAYKINIKYNCSNNEIITYINDIEIFKICNKTFEQTKVGFLSPHRGTIFTQFLLEY